MIVKADGLSEGTYTSSFLPSNKSGPRGNLASLNFLIDLPFPLSFNFIVFNVFSVIYHYFDDFLLLFHLLPIRILVINKRVGIRVVYLLM